MSERAHSVLASVAGGIGTLVLASDAKRNALSLATMRDLTQALDRLDRDPAVRVIVLRAIGSVFGAGHDLRELMGRNAAAYDEIFDACVVLMERCERSAEALARHRHLSAPSPSRPSGRSPRSS